MRAKLTTQAARQIGEGFSLNQEAWEILDLIVSEWQSDPASVACFDLRVVERAGQIVTRRKELDKVDWLPVFGRK